MKLIEKIKARRLEKYWRKQGRKDLFTWTHRYLRLHVELLSDSVYQDIYNYTRNTLILYLKNDLDSKKLNDPQLGELVDVLADIFNKNETELVNKYKLVVEELYKEWAKISNEIKEIRV